MLIVPSRLPDIPIAILVILGAARFLKPFMLITSVVHDEIHEQLHAPIMTSLNQLLNICDRTELLSDSVVIGNIISLINAGRLVRWTQPDNVHADILDIIKLRDQSWDISNAIIVRVLIRSRPDLVNGAFLPPGAMVIRLDGGHDGNW